VLEELICGPVLLVAVVALQGVVVHLRRQLVDVHLGAVFVFKILAEIRGPVCHTPPTILCDLLQVL